MPPNPPSTSSTHPKPEPETATNSMLSTPSDVKIEESRLTNVARDMFVVTINSSLPNHQGGYMQKSQSASPLNLRNVKVEDDDGTSSGQCIIKAEIDDRGQSRRHVRFLSGFLDAIWPTSHLDSDHSIDVKNESLTGNGSTVKKESSTHELKPNVDQSMHSPPEIKPHAEVVGLCPSHTEEVSQPDSMYATCTVSHIVPKMSIPRMYSRLMFVHELGYPLYVPEPNQDLEEYRKEGIRIGDVGRVTPTGSFDFLFNACYPADHPINPELLPDGFEPLTTVDRLVTEVFGDETLLLSENVKQTNDSPITYQCAGPEGAVLALPDGAICSEAQNLEDFRKYAARHAESWYKYLKTRGRNAPNGALYFVTGCIKSRNWGIAAFYRGETDGNSVQFVSNGDSYKWVKSGRVIARMGPRSQSSTGKGKEEFNQCTFLSGYKIMLRDDLWDSLESKICVPAAEDQHSDVHTKMDGTNMPSSVASGDGKADQNGGNTPTRNHRTEDSDVIISEDLIASSPQCSPLDFINSVLLSSEPRAKVALVHDIQWKGALPKQYTVEPSRKKIAQMLFNVFQSHEAVLDEFDCIHLVQTFNPFFASGQEDMHKTRDYTDFLVEPTDFTEAISLGTYHDPNPDFYTTCHHLDFTMGHDDVHQKVHSASWLTPEDEVLLGAHLGDVEQTNYTTFTNLDCFDMIGPAHNYLLIYSEFDVPETSTSGGSDFAIPSLYSSCSGAMSHFTEVPVIPSETVRQVGSEKMKVAAMKRRRKEPEFQCPVCSATFTAKHNLKYHMNAHLGLKPYMCELEGCAYAATDPAGLKRHVRSCVLKSLDKRDQPRKA